MRHHIVAKNKTCVVDPAVISRSVSKTKINETIMTPSLQNAVLRDQYTLRQEPGDNLKPKANKVQNKLRDIFSGDVHCNVETL